MKTARVNKQAVRKSEVLVPQSNKNKIIINGRLSGNLLNTAKIDDKLKEIGQMRSPEKYQDRKCERAKNTNKKDHSQALTIEKYANEALNSVEHIEIKKSFTKEQLLNSN